MVLIGDDELLHQLQARARQNDQLERAGCLNPIPFDVAATRQTIAKRIRSALRDRRMTQAQLAKSLNATPHDISRILISPDSSDIETLKRIAAALRVDVVDFF